MNGNQTHPQHLTCSTFGEGGKLALLRQVGMTVEGYMCNRGQLLPVEKRDLRFTRPQKVKEAEKSPRPEAGDWMQKLGSSASDEVHREK